MQVPGPTQELLNLFFMGPWNLHLPHFTQRVLRRARARTHTHTHTHTHTSIAQAQVRAMRQRQPDSLLGGGEAGEVPETPTFCLSFDLHYERGGPEIFGVTGTGSGHHCVLFVGFNFSFVSLR